MTFRVLSSSPSTVLPTKARTFASLRIQPSSLLTAQRSSFPLLQRRFASDEAVTQSEPEADGATEAQHGDNSIAAAAADSLESDLSRSEEGAAAASSNSVVDGATLTEDTGAPPPEAGRRRSVASEAAASVAGAAAAVGSSLSSAAGFGGHAAQSASESTPSKTIYVGNLFFDVRAEDLSQEFGNAGTVVDAKVITDSRGLSKG